jgi:hypothetical protein
VRGSRELAAIRRVPAAEEIEASLLAGEHALHVEGDVRAGRKRFEAAYRGAERQRDGRAMARAALGLGGLWAQGHRRAAEAAMTAARQRAALDVIDRRSSLALRLRVRLAAEEDIRSGTGTAVLALVEEARRAGDPVPLAEALNLAHQCLIGPDHGALRLGLAQELIGEAPRTARAGDLLLGLLWYTVDLFKEADPQAERSLAELRGLLARGDHVAVAAVVGAIDVMLAIRGGRFDQAEAMAAERAERGAAAGIDAAPAWHAAQLGTIRGFQGRLSELLPMLSTLVTAPVFALPDSAGYGGLAVAAAAAGDRRLAAATLARLSGRVLADRPPAGSWLMAMCCAVDVAHQLADAQTAARLYARLRPYARLPAMLGVGVVCLGSVHRHLGLACLTSGDADRAIDHLRQAVQDNLALGHWPAVVLSRRRLGEALALRDGPRDEAARRELDLAEQEAAAVGMTPPPAGPGRRSAGRTGGDGIGVGVGSGVGNGDHGRAGPPPVVTCRRRGRRWEIRLGGRAALVDDYVGVRHLAALLANPGYEISATDLAAGPAPTGVAAASAQPVLDEIAVRKYRDRLVELQADLDELQSMNEIERVAAVRAERDWLMAELAAAAGMGGRPRAFANGEERARIAVGKAIRRAIDRIAAADPVIGGELRATILTGRLCSYRPE